MYTTIVKVRNVLEGKDVFKILIPIGIWIGLMIIAILMLSKTPLAILFIFAIFLAIIPTILYMNKSMDKYRSEKSFIEKEVTFNINNGNLYVDNKKMNISQDKSKTKIFIDDIDTSRTRRTGTSIHATFIGVIEEPYYNDFIKFLNENEIKISK